MTAYELHDLLIEYRSLIMNTWQFFVSIHLTMLGLAFVVRFEEPRWILRAMILIGYFGFMCISYNAQMDNHRYSFALIEYLEAIDTRSTIEQERALHEVFHKGWVLPYLPWIYVAAGALGLTAILLPAVVRKRSERQDAAPAMM